MGNWETSTEVLIVLSMMNRIVVDDLLTEEGIEQFEEKKKWYDCWKEEIIKMHNLEQELLDWDELKMRVIKWLNDGRAVEDKQALLDRCLAFLPYGPLPGGAYCNSSAGSSGGFNNGKERAIFKLTQRGKIQASQEAREISLEKIYRLLDLDC